MKFIHQPREANRLGDYLAGNFAKPWTHFRAAVAFVKRSGTRQIAAGLSEFGKHGNVELIVGIDHHGTSEEGLRDLLIATKPNGRIIVFHNRTSSTFHPKIYLFKSQDAAQLMIGSGNLTGGGLYTNYEASFCLDLDLNDRPQSKLLASVEEVLDEWSDPSLGIAKVLDEQLLSILSRSGRVRSERETDESDSSSERTAASPENGSLENDDAADDFNSLFLAVPVPPAPRVREPAQSSGEPSRAREQSETTDEPIEEAQPPQVTNFVMTLHQTDVGYGQVAAGTSRRSPEIFVPLAARNANPAFWEWRDGFVEDNNRPGKWDRANVRMRLGAETILVSMMTWPDRRDFRLRSEALRNAGEVGDILRLEKVEPGREYEYVVEIISHETREHPLFLERCREPVRNSQKRYGYY